MLNTAFDNKGYPSYGMGMGGLMVVWVGRGWRFGGAHQHRKLYVSKGAAICCY
jgi:hypothetical protein